MNTEQSINTPPRINAYHSLKLPLEDGAGSTPAPAHIHLHHHHSFSAAEALANSSVNPVNISHGYFLNESHSVSSAGQDDEMARFHVPDHLCTTCIPSFCPHLSLLVPFFH